MIPRLEAYWLDLVGLFYDEDKILRNHCLLHYVLLGKHCLRKQVTSLRIHTTADFRRLQLHGIGR